MSVTVVASLPGPSPAASFAIPFALLFPSIPICPGTYDTSIIALLLASRNIKEICDIPGLILVLHSLLKRLIPYCWRIVRFLTVVGSLRVAFIGIFPFLSVVPAFRCRRLRYVLLFPRFRALLPLHSSILFAPIKLSIQ